MKKAITTIPAAVALGTVSVSAVSFKDIDPFFDYMNDGDELRGWFDIVFGYGDLVTMVGGYADKGTTHEDVVGFSPGFDLIESAELFFYFLDDYLPPDTSF